MSQSNTNEFPIAALGASAGGLEAFEKFFKHMPADAGIGFLVVQQCVFGVYLGCSFAPNHKGMPLLDDAESTDFFRRQVLTARNITGGRVMSAVFGGLNYQIEHHLFPSMPRPSLKRAQPLVRAFCAELGVPYVEASLVGSYRRSVGHLNAVGKSA